jgi:hypothetical protein
VAYKKKSVKDLAQILQNRLVEDVIREFIEEGGKC